MIDLSTAVCCAVEQRTWAKRAVKWMKEAKAAIEDNHGENYSPFVFLDNQDKYTSALKELKLKRQFYNEYMSELNPEEKKRVLVYARNSIIPRALEFQCQEALRLMKYRNHQRRNKK